MNTKLAPRFFSLVLLFSPTAVFAQSADTQIPPAVETQAQAIEEKFNAVLKDECGDRSCSSAGCEVVGFRTLDQKQNASLPGLDESDDAPGPLQYKLESIRCEFAFEPTLSNEAVTSLRQRLGTRVRQAGVTVLVAGRKLAASPAIKEPVKTEEPSPWAPLRGVLPQLLLILAGTLGVLSLIWGFRRLGKPRVPATATAASAPTTAIETPAAPEAGPTPPSAFELLNKQKYLTDLLAGDPALAQATIEPLVERGDTGELCRVLRHFGPAPLAYFASRPEYRDLFVRVHEAFAVGTPEETPAVTGAFFEKIERLVALGQLGRPAPGPEAELEFLKTVDASEFRALVASLPVEETMALLAFVPARLRRDFLQAQGPAFTQSYGDFVLAHPRLSESRVRETARHLRELFAATHAALKSVALPRTPLLEQLLNSLDPAARSRLLARMKAEDPELFRHLTSEVLFDRAVKFLPAAVLNEIFLSLPPEEAVGYLKSQPDRAEILARLNPALGKMLSERLAGQVSALGLDLDFAGEEEDPAARSAKDRLNELLKQKAARGEINLRSLNESVTGPL